MSEMPEFSEDERRFMEMINQRIKEHQRRCDERAERRERIDWFASSALNGYLAAGFNDPKQAGEIISQCYDRAYLMEAERERRIKAEAGQHD